MSAPGTGADGGRAAAADAGRDSPGQARLRQLAEEQAALRRVATLVARGIDPAEIFSAVDLVRGRPGPGAADAGAAGRDRGRTRYRDDGAGGADPARGSGLIGLRDRVEALGGSFEVSSPPGEGTLISVQLSLRRH
jgi:hypothetical protein